MNANQSRSAARSIILDGALDPEFVLELADFDVTNEADLAFVRLVNSVNICYKVWGDEYLRSLGIDPSEVVF